MAAGLVPLHERFQGKSECLKPQNAAAEEQALQSGRCCIALLAAAATMQRLLAARLSAPTAQLVSCARCSHSNVLEAVLPAKMTLCD